MISLAAVVPGTAMEHIPRDQDVLGSKPSNCWPIILLFYFFLRLLLSLVPCKTNDFSQSDARSAELLMCAE